MKKQLEEIFHRNHFVPFIHDEITLLGVENAEVGIKNANIILLELIDRNTAIFLSGGITPRDLYRDFAMDQMIVPQSVGMIDERYGERFHETSNERMIKETTLLDYLERQDIPFYPMLSDEQKTREKLALEYEEIFQKVLSQAKQSIGILGIGPDGHTAGIAPSRLDPSGRLGNAFQNPLFEGYQKGLAVSEFNDSTGPFKERITLTFVGLSFLDLYIILAFGENKKIALQKMFTVGSEEEIPARFYKRPDIAKKTLIITDQDV